MSMLSHLAATAQDNTSNQSLQSRKTIRQPVPVTLLYATPLPRGNEEPLFLSRLLGLLQHPLLPFRLELFFGSQSSSTPNIAEKLSLPPGVPVHDHRMALDDVRHASDRILADSKEQSGDQRHNRTGDRKAEGIAYYVCGPQKMTDDFVEEIKRFDNVEEADVMCEKWW